MAITHTEVQVTWPTAANTGTVTAGSTVTSEEIVPDDTAIAARIIMKAEYTAGAPASDDIIEFWLLENHGDPDGASTDEFSTAPQAANEAGGAIHLATLDLNDGETSGSGKMVKYACDFPVPMKGAKLFASGVTAGSTNSVTVSATITEQRAA